jgi:hypothetical protein
LGASKIRKAFIGLGEPYTLLNLPDEHNPPWRAIAGGDAEDVVARAHPRAHRFLAGAEVKAIAPLRWYRVKLLLGVVFRA